MKIKVLNLNIFQGNFLNEAIEFIKQQDADIVCLQEVYDGVEPDLEDKYRTLSILKSRLDYQYYDFAPATIDVYPFGKVPQGNLIISKLPIIRSEVKFFSGSLSERDPDDPKTWPVTPRNLQSAAVDLPEGELNIFNLQGVWDLDGDNFSSQRQAMTETIIEAVKDKQRTVLAGDTNATPNGRAIKDIKEHLEDVFGDSLVSTFNMKQKTNPGYATAVVDFIFVSRDIKVIERSCPNVDISDHLPLVATLEV